MKALLHLKDGKNDTVELLIDISERTGDIKEFVNAAYTSSYYRGELSYEFGSLTVKVLHICPHLSSSPKKPDM